MTGCRISDNYHISEFIFWRSVKRTKLSRQCVVLFFFLLVIWLLTSTTYAGSPGRLEAEDNGLVLMGDFAAGERQTIRFQLRNTGDAPIGIKAVSKSCGCADAEMSTNLVAAGAEVVITLKTLPGKLAGHFSKSVYVITTSKDPLCRAVQLTLIGHGIESAGSKRERGTSGKIPVSAEQGNEIVSVDGYSRQLHKLEQYPLEVEFFVQEGCADCLQLRRDYLPALAKRYDCRLSLIVSDTHDHAAFMRLLDTLESFGVTANEPLYMVVGGKVVLSGWREVERRGFDAIDSELSGNPAVSVVAKLVTGEGVASGHRASNKDERAFPERKVAVASENVSEHAADRLFRRFRWTAVAAAGLSDGLNPCAFATIVFLTSLLATGGRRGGVVLLGGLSFCLASFATYFLIGLGLLSALRQLDGLTAVRAVVEWTTIAVLIVFSLLSLLDAWRYGHTGDARVVWLKLPNGLKRRIHSFAQAQWGGAAIFGTGLICGAGVTVLESVCTGQMYLPTLVFMSREGGGLRAWSLLLLYNILFIVPLFAVFVFGALGIRSQLLADWTRRHVIPSKLLLAVVFLFLAFLLAVNAMS